MFFKSKPTNLPAPEVLTQQIVSALNLTPNDLTINRQGKLSPAQIQSLERFMKKSGKSMLIIVPLVIIISLGFMAIQFSGTEGDGLRQVFNDNPLIIIAGVGGSLLLYLLAMAISFFRARNFQVANLKVRSADGKVKITRTQLMGTMWAVMKAAGAQGYSYELKVGRQKIYSHDASVEQAFVKDAKYRIYYAKMYNIAYFVAAEAIPENA